MEEHVQQLLQQKPVLHSFVRFSPENWRMSPENQWLEDIFPIETISFRWHLSVFGGVYYCLIFFCTEKSLEVANLMRDLEPILGFTWHYDSLISISNSYLTYEKAKSGWTQRNFILSHHYFLLQVQHIQLNWYTTQKLTWQWKNNHLFECLLLKMVIFHCQASFWDIKCWEITTTSPHKYEKHPHFAFVPEGHQSARSDRPRRVRPSMDPWDFGVFFFQKVRLAACKAEKGRTFQI